MAITHNAQRELGQLCLDEGDRHNTLLDVFTATVDRFPDRVAIDAADSVLTYTQLQGSSELVAERLHKLGIGRGDRVGIRMSSGQASLYVAILGVLSAGAAYVPVDIEDPPSRAEAIWRGAGVCAVLEDELEIVRLASPACLNEQVPGGEDDAWVIFTSGSTGAPKGVAVSHRAAAAFVQAERSLWTVLPEDRVLAGLSVAFDASCEEMWLAWGNGAALVPAPRSLVRAGSELGPWLAQRHVSVVSTVPTLACMWEPETLTGVRLLILGGEACPPELGWRLAGEREVWNTYGPTEATVVSTAARIKPGQPVTIGWPLNGWKVAVVDKAGQPVALGEPGELVIAGTGLGRYLDGTLDRRRYAPLPALGWDRAYRTGDLVRETAEGLDFVGRRDHQVKLGGRRLELGEVEARLSAVAGVRAAVAKVQQTAAANQVLVGYVAGDVDPAHVRAQVAEHLPDGLAPLVVVLKEIPMAASGKVDRAALPWPAPDSGYRIDPSLSATGAWLAQRWIDQLGPMNITADSDFFLAGASSLTAAKLVSVLRERFPSVAISDVYEYRSLGRLARRLDQLGEAASESPTFSSSPLRGLAVMQIAGVLGLTALASAQWIIAAFCYSNIESDGLPHVSWIWLIAGWIVLSSPVGRLGILVLARRVLLRDLRPGRYPRGSWLTARVWFLERLGEYCNIARFAGTPWAARCARLIGCDVDPQASLASMPTVTSLVHIGPGATVEAQVDMHGWWIDGQELVIGEIYVGAGASVGSRTLLAPGASIGERAEIEPGSVISGDIPADEHWGGSPARHLGAAGKSWPSQAPVPSSHRRFWRCMFSLSFTWEAALVLLALAPGIAILILLGAPAPSLECSPATLLGEAALLAVTATVTLAVLIAVVLRLVWKLVRPGWHGEDGGLGWAMWFSGELKESASAVLFALYASLYTRGWLRTMGIPVGPRTEISTSTGLNPLVSFGAYSHATDDVGFCGTRARGGWLRVEPIEIGSRTFLGPGAILREGTRLGDDSLVGALTLAPRRPGSGTSWIGVPALELPRLPESGDPGRTTDPARRLILGRAVMDTIRIFLPNIISLAIGIADLLVLGTIAKRAGLAVMVSSAPLVMLGSGLFSTAIAVGIKWIAVGRYRAGRHPLWSFFVWRDELVNTAHEQLAGEWLLRFAIGTPLMSLYLRAMGSKVGRGVWVETTAITEYDVVKLSDGCVVNRGACLMTHVFQDRLLRIGPTHIGAGATMGPTSAVLPDTTLGANTCIGGHAVVLRGEQLPAGTRWHGSPVKACGA